LAAAGLFRTPANTVSAARKNQQMRAKIREMRITKALKRLALHVFVWC